MSGAGSRTCWWARCISSRASPARRRRTWPPSRRRCFPEMKKRGANEGDLVALLAATGAQTDTVPPSLVLITHWVGDGRFDCRALFTGGLVAGDGARSHAVRGGLVRTAHEDLRHVTRAPCASGRATAAIALPGVGPALRDSRRGRSKASPPRPRSRRSASLAVIAGLLVYRQFDGGGLGPMLVRDGIAVGHDAADHRHGHGDGLGPHAIGILTPLSQTMAALPGGAAHVPGRLRRGVRGAGLRAGRHPRGRAVRRRCCSRSRGSWAFTTCTTRWWSCCRWTLGLFAPPHGRGLLHRLHDRRVHPGQGHPPDLSATCWPADRDVVVTRVPWISTGFL